MNELKLIFNVFFFFLRSSTDCEVKIKSELAEAFIKLYKETADENLRTKLKQVFKMDEKTIEDLKLNSVTVKQETTSKLVENKRDAEEKNQPVEASSKTAEKVEIVEKPEITVPADQNAVKQSGEHVKDQQGDDLEARVNEGEGILLPEHKKENDEPK